MSLHTYNADLQRVVVTGNRPDGLGIILRHTGDPRWNSPEFVGMRVRIQCPDRALAGTVSVTWHMEACARRWCQSAQHPVPADGWLILRDPPEGWTATTRIDIDGLPGPSFIFGPIERL